MRRILFLNQNFGPSTGRQYDQFMIAYCIARLGIEVIYITDKEQQFVNEFREGPVYNIDELFNREVIKVERVMQPGIFCNIAHILSNPEIVKDIVDAFGGRPDLVITSGDYDWERLSEQIAQYYKVSLYKFEDNELSPCLNWNEYKIVTRAKPRIQRRAVTCYDYISQEDIKILDMVLCQFPEPLFMYVIGRPDNSVNLSTIDRSKIAIIYHVSDRGRLQAIYNSLFYIQMPFTTRIQGVIEALSLGLPVYNLSYNEIFAKKGIQSERIFIEDNITKLYKTAEIREANYDYSFMNRMAELIPILRRL